MADGRQTQILSSEPVKAEDVDWLLGHLRAVVASSPSAVWAGRGMTLLQLSAMHLISALAPISLSELARALGTRLPATSAMVDRLTHVGMVSRTPDPDNRRRVRLTPTALARIIIGDTAPDTARRLHTVLARLSPQIRGQVMDVLRDSVQHSAV